MDENSHEFRNKPRNRKAHWSHDVGTDNDSLDLSRRSLLRTTGVLAGAGMFGVGTGSAYGKSHDSNQEEGNYSSRPGPEILYESLASAPQLENMGSWSADPLLVSGTDAYLNGEYLYQDYVYDDYGANTTNTNAPPQPAPNNSNTYGENGVMTGDVVYPTDADSYRYNAADLLEFRATPAGNRVKYRITLNSMVEPDAAGIAIGIDTGDGSGSDEWGYGIGSLGPLDLDHVLVTWGDDAELDGESVESNVDLERNQIEVTVPLDPNKETWRHYAVVGLFDAGAKEFKQVQNGTSATHPGGSARKEPAADFQCRIPV